LKGKKMDKIGNGGDVIRKGQKEMEMLG